MSTINSTSKGKSNNAGNLVKDIFTTIIFIGLTILVGTTSLYTCRVSQSNILPTDINCFPYTNQVEKPEEIGIDINVFYDADKKEKVSEKIRFPYDDNIKKEKHGNYIIQYLKYISDKVNDTKTTPLLKYFLKTCQESVVNSMTILDFCATLINANFSESLIIISGYFTSLFIWLITLVINIIYCFYLWVANLSIFFEGQSVMSIAMNWKFWLILFLSLIFFPITIIIIILFIALTPLLAIFNIILSILLPLSMKAKKKRTRRQRLYLCRHVFRCSLL